MCYVNLQRLRISVVLIALAILIIGAKQIAAQTVAEVTDKSGTKVSVRAFSLEYAYSYRMGNCIGACDATGYAPIDLLPLNQVCGATMIPLGEIKSISRIAQDQYNEPYHATVTFIDGREVATKFGDFGGVRLSGLKGEASLGVIKGAWSLPLSETVQIVFQHEQNAGEVPTTKWLGADSSKANANVLCQGGVSYSLSKMALFYEVSGDRNGPGVSKALRVMTKLGQSSINTDIDFGLVESITRSPKGSPGEFTLVTTSGQTIPVFFTDKRFVGGFREGHFYLVPVSELQNFKVER